MSDSRLTIFSRVSPRVAGLCGILGPIIGFVFIAAAIHSAPWFSWTHNWISDMGGTDGERPVWSARGTESVLLNAGVMIIGSMGIVFAAGVRRIAALDTHRGRRGTLLLLTAMIAMVTIGIFPMSITPVHYFVALTFFILMPFSMLLIGSELKTASNPAKGAEWLRRQGSYTYALGAATLIFAPLLGVPRPWGGNAIAEMFTAFSIPVFCMMFGHGLWKGRFELIGAGKEGK